jgi:hypothetical protein
MGGGQRTGGVDCRAERHELWRQILLAILELLAVAGVA